MNKLFWIFLVSGFGMIFGGLALLFVSGYDALNPGVWSVAWGIIQDSPMLLIEAAQNGGDANLFRGILFVFCGLAAVAMSGVVVAIASAVGKVAGLFRGLSAARKAAPKESIEKPEKAKGGPSFLEVLKAKFSEKFTKDPVVELESSDDVDDAPKPSKIVDLGTAASTKHVKVNRPFKDEIKEMFAEFVGRIKSLKSGDKSQQDTLVFKEVGRSGRVGEFGNLTTWFEDVQKGSEDSGVLVERARKICSEWEKEDFAEYASRDPINGAFVVRLVQSWATRDLDEDPVSEARVGDKASKREKEKEAIRAAMRAMKNGESLAIEGEEEVDLDADTALEDLEEISDDLTGEDDDLEAMMSEAAEGMEGGADEGGEDDQDDDLEALMSEAAEGMETNGSGDNQGGSYDEIQGPEEGAEDTSSAPEDDTGFVGVLGEMKSYVFLVNAVASGEDEWPEDLSGESQREEFVTSLSSAFEVATMVSDEDVLDTAERLRDEYDEFEWLLENPEIANEGFVVFVASLGSYSGDEEGFEDEDQDTEAELSGGESEEDPAVDSSAMEAALAALGMSSDEDEDETISEGGEEQPEGQDAAPEDGGTGVAEGGTDEGDPEGIQEQPEGAPHEPKDLSIPPMMEISESRGIPIIWGKTSREAGATRASVGQLVLEKGSDSFEPIGMAHLVTLWKNHDSTVRMNVVLKKVPEGEWSLRLTDGVRMENEKGDFVEVEKRFLDHKEIKSAKTIIHFYGPGVVEFDPVQVGSDMMVVSKAFSVEEIREFVTK